MKKRSTFIFLLALVISIVACIYLYEKVNSSRQIIYPNFGISLPQGYSIHGIDVSKYQRKINWKLVSEMRDKNQKIHFAIMKATEGTHMKDQQYERNWKECKKNNIIRGAYLYFRCNRDAVKQAEFFIENVQYESGDILPVIDIEDTHRMNANEIQKSLKICADILEKKYNKKPIIYTNADYYTKNLEGVFDAYPLWIAHYEQPTAPRIGRRWNIWQHHCKGRVNGIVGDVDFNVVNGTKQHLTLLCF